jgi:DNA-binding transcriptional LysR family regulator
MVAASVRRLVVFKTVVDCDGVNAAAAQLGIAQPSVTAHIKALEAEIGTSLFFRQRGRRHLARTAAGDTLYQYACEAIARSKQIDELIRQDRKAQRLNIAAQRLLANNILPSALADFQSDAPDAQVSVHSEIQERVWELIRSGEADVAVLFARNKPERVDARLLGSLPLVLIASHAHPLAKKRNVALSDIISHGFVGGLKESEFFQMVLGALADVGLRGCRFVMHLQDSAAVKQAVLRNLGIACTFRLVVQEELARKELIAIRLSMDIPRLPVYAIHGPGEQPNGLASRLIDRIEETLKRLPDANDVRR